MYENKVKNMKFKIKVRLGIFCNFGVKNVKKVIIKLWNFLKIYESFKLHKFIVLELSMLLQLSDGSIQRELQRFQDWLNFYFIYKFYEVYV